MNLSKKDILEKIGREIGSSKKNSSEEGKNGGCVPLAPGQPGLAGGQFASEEILFRRDAGQR